MDMRLLIDLVLASSTVFSVVVTCLLTWVSWKLYRVDAEKVSEVANNSIDSMEHVAVTAITHQDRVRQLKHVRKYPLP